jgi:SPP1 gp7 family putative phage head morphogenesis protein
MADPLVVQAMRRFKAGLMAREAAQMQAMAARWMEVERALEEQIAALARTIADLQASGQVISRGRLLQMERYHDLLAQATSELGRYDEYAARIIERNQNLYIQLGLDQAAAALDAVGVAFNRLNPAAVEFMAGLTAQGAPLLDLLNKRALPGAAIGLTNELLKATALGWNPRKTARAMKDGLAQGLNKALQIARTEQLRVLREATRLGYQQSGVVEAYRRLASKSLRTCPACLMADGKRYELHEPLDEHVSGRCTIVPVIRGIPDDKWETGREWFEKQPESAQRSILGPGMYDAWRAGKFDLVDLVKAHHDDTWGDSLQTKSLKELLGADDYRRATGRGSKVMGSTWYQQRVSGALDAVEKARAAGNAPGGWAAYEERVRQAAQRRGVSVQEMERVIGLWGTPEPSLRSELAGGKEKVKLLARDLRKSDKQDAVAVLIPKRGGEGGLLTWKFKTALSDRELNALLSGIRAVNEQLSKEELGFEIGVTSRGDRLEFWFGDRNVREVGKTLIGLALERAGLTARVSSRLGYELFLA